MRNFSNAKRVVIKIGTNVLTTNSGINTAYVRRIAKQVKTLQDKKLQVLIVSSGAIGMGAGQLGLTEKVKNMKMRQACAAIGQPLLMDEYRKSFMRYGVTVAQVLLTAEVMNNRKTYLNLRNSIEKLLELGGTRLPRVVRHTDVRARISGVATISSTTSSAFSNAVQMCPQERH